VTSTSCLLERTTPIDVAIVLLSYQCAPALLLPFISTYPRDPCRFCIASSITSLIVSYIASRQCTLPNTEERYQFLHWKKGPTIPVFERAETFQALGSSASAMSQVWNCTRIWKDFNGKSDRLFVILAEEFRVLLLQECRDNALKYDMTAYSCFLLFLDVVSFNSTILIYFLIEIWLDNRPCHVWGKHEEYITVTTLVRIITPSRVIAYIQQHKFSHGIKPFLGLQFLSNILLILIRSIDMQLYLFSFSSYTTLQATWQPHKPHKTIQLIKKHMRKTTKAHGYHMYSP
jgi:hypothetical protein